MYVFDSGAPEVHINLSNGIYVFQNVSAVGKSYLASVLRSLRSAGEPVDSFSFSDVKKFGDLEQALSGIDFKMGDLRVILFDRYDQYVGAFTDIIQRLGEKCIVLIDCKHRTKLKHVNRCVVSFNESVIEVKIMGNILDSKRHVVESNLPVGLFLLPSDSATGKTRLKRLLDYYKGYGVNVSTYTYVDYLNKVDPLSVCKDTDSLILFDRYDMYMGACDNAINALANKTTVLVDSKRGMCSGGTADYCTLEMVSPNKIILSC